MEESLKYRFEGLKDIICFSEENLYKVLSKINEIASIIKYNKCIRDTFIVFYRLYKKIV